MSNYESALPDANQETVLPKVVVAGGSPNFGPGRTEIVGKQGDTGAVKVGPTELATGPQRVPTSTEYLHDSSGSSMPSATGGAIS